MTDVFNATDSGAAIPLPATETNTGDNQPFDFIGEGKQYATQDIALSAIPHKDKHIATLEEENARLRTQAQSSKTVDDVLSALGSGDQNANTVSTTTPANQPEDLSETVRGVLQEEEQLRTAKTNLGDVNKQLSSMFGDEANVKVAEKAAELGMDTNTLQLLAERSPAACMALFSNKDSGTQSDEGTTHPHTSDVNTEALGTQGVSAGTKAYYDNLRRTDRKKYMSRDVQLQLMRDAESNPAKYFGNAA